MNRTFLRELWRLTRPYWVSEDKRIAWTYFAVLLAMTVGLVYMSVQFNSWYGRFYNALQVVNADAIWRELGTFVILAAIAVVVAVYRLYLNQMLSLRWRRWLTDRYLDEWLRGHAYYALQMRGNATDNPDQRIAEDIDQYIGQTLSLFFGLVDAVLTLVSFTVILWGLSGTIPIPGTDIQIPGDMVWIAIVYAAIGTWLTHLIGRPLIQLQYDRQRVEANFRYSMVRFRENVEGVALYGGEKDERKIFGERFAFVVSNTRDIIHRTKKVTWFTASFGQLSVIFPFVVSLPRFIAGQIPLGALIQISQAFGQVQGSLSFFIDAYRTLAVWKATVDRLILFRAAMDAAHAEDAAHKDIAVTSVPAANGLSIVGLDLALPEGPLLMKDLNLTVKPGERVLLCGPSGMGKTTLFRAVAGLWPFGRGTIEIPDRGGVLFLPQKPYLPIGTLRRATTYPASEEGFTDAQVQDTLRLVGLGKLVDRLDEPAYWPQVLSPGEQQRLAFARAILQRPDWLFMDEASSALDEASEAQLFAALRQRLPDSTLVSIGHRATLSQFHTREVQLAAQQAQVRLAAAGVSAGEKLPH